MRCVWWTCLLAMILVLACGCLQAAPPGPPPVPSVAATPAVPVTLPPAITATPDMQKQVNFTVSPATSQLNITYNGGPDAPDLVSITVRITNRDGTQVDPRTINYPVIGATYVFTYRGVANPAIVNILGTFRNGYQQTVLMYYV